MTRCPLCRARYRGGEICRRCGADLQLLVSLERAADLDARHAVCQLVSGNMDEAGHYAGRAKKRHATSFNKFLDDFILQYSGLG